MPCCEWCFFRVRVRPKRVRMTAYPCASGLKPWCEWTLSVMRVNDVWEPFSTQNGPKSMGRRFESEGPKHQKARTTAAFWKKKVPDTIVSRTYLLFGRLWCFWYKVKPPTGIFETPLRIFETPCPKVETPSGKKWNTLPLSFETPTFHRGFSAIAVLRVITGLCLWFLVF